MRLVKLFSLLLCIVLFIGLCSFTVSAERIEEDGWYRFSNSDIAEVVSNNIVTDFYENKSFPITGNTDFNGATENFYIDLLYNIGSSNGWVNVPSGYTLEVETRVTYYAYDKYDTAFAGFSKSPISITASGQDLDDIGKSYTINSSSYTLESGRQDIAIFKMKWTNDTGFDIGFSEFRYGNSSPYTDSNWMRYQIRISWLRFRILSGSEVQTETIINGWSPDPQRPSGSDVADQQQQLENQINQDTEVGRQETSNLMNGFASHIFQFSGGFSLFLGMFNRMIPIGWLSAMVSISLALGLFMFVFNLVPSLVDRSSAASARRNAPTLTIRIRGGKK